MIPFSRPVITCFLYPESRNLNGLVLILFCLARARARALRQQELRQPARPGAAHSQFADRFEKSRLAMPATDAVKPGMVCRPRNACDKNWASPRQTIAVNGVIPVIVKAREVASNTRRRHK